VDFARQRIRDRARSLTCADEQGVASVWRRPARPAMLIHQKLGVTNDVDEEGLRDPALNLF